MHEVIQGIEIRFSKDAAKKAVERIRDIEMVEIKVPDPSGGGATYEELVKMADNMKAIYDEVQKLIKASGDMIEKMYIPLSEADGGPFGGSPSDLNMGGR